MPQKYKVPKDLIDKMQNSGMDKIRDWRKSKKKKNKKS